jgi:hypothetical protein
METKSWTGREQGEMGRQLKAGRRQIGVNCLFGSSTTTFGQNALDEMVGQCFPVPE